jgi:hypothetical protein
MAAPYYLEAPKGEEYKPTFGDKLERMWDAIPSESLYSLAEAMARPGGNFASKFTTGLAGFGRQIGAANKRKGLSSAFDSMAAQIPEQMRPIFEEARNDPEMQRMLMGGMVSKMVEPQKRDEPFSGTGVEASALNIVIKGQGDPSLRSTPEYQMAWRKLTEPQIIRDAAGNMSLYTPPPPKGMLPPEMGGQQIGQGGQPMPQPAMTRPSPSAQMPTGAPPPRLSNAPALPPGMEGFVPEDHPELGDGMMPPSASVPAPGGGTVTALPGTSPVGSSEASQIRQAINTTIPSVKTALNAYRASLKNTGRVDRLIGVGPANAAAKSEHTNLLLQLKELFNLGVLNGPDYTLMLKMVEAPDTFEAFAGGRESIEAQLNATEKYLNAKIEEWNQRAKTAGIKGVVPTKKAATPADDPLGIR